MSWEIITPSAVGYAKLRKLGISRKGLPMILASNERDGAFISIEEDKSFQKLADLYAKYEGFDFVQAQTKTIFFSDGMPKVVNESTGELTEITIKDSLGVEKPLQLGDRSAKISDGDRVYAFGDLVNGNLVDFGSLPPSVRKVNNNYAGYSDAFFEGAVLKNDYLYFLDREGAKNYYKDTRDSTKVRRSVWQFNLSTGEKIDISANLEALSTQGLPYGEVRDLVSNPEKTKLWVSTQEGIFEADISTDDPSKVQWLRIRSSNGNSRIEFSEGKLFVINYNRFGLMLGVYQGVPGKWAYTKVLKRAENKSINSLVSVKGVVYLLETFGNILCYDLSLLDYKDYSDVKVAKYLGVGEITAAAQSKTTDELFLAKEGEVLAVSLSGETKTLLSLELGEKVLDIASSSDALYLLTTLGVRVFKFKNREGAFIPLSSSLFNTVPKGKISVGGKIFATLISKNLSIYDIETQSLLSSRLIVGSHIDDVAVSEEDLIYVCGHNDYFYTANSGRRFPVKVPILREYTYEKEGGIVQKRTLWNYNPTELGQTGNMADAKALFLKVVKGKLIVQCETAGGNTLLRWSGEDLETNTQIISDNYNLPTNADSSHLCYFAVIDIESWKIERGQFIFPRLKRGGRTNSCFARGVYSPDGESIHLALKSAFQLPQREVMRFAGQAVATYNGDASFALVDGDWTSRKFWLTPGSGEPLFISDRFAVVKTDKSGTDLPTTDKSAGNTLGDAYLVVW